MASNGTPTPSKRLKAEIPEELLRRTGRKRKQVNYSQEVELDEESSQQEDDFFESDDSEDDDDDDDGDFDDEDDEPLSKLAKKKRGRPAGKKTSPAKGRGRPKGKAKSTGKAKRVKSSGSKRSDPSSSSGKIRTAKEQLVVDILRRRRYCLQTWPPEDGDYALPNKDFIATGFRGIIVGYKGDSIGIMKDLRPKTGVIPSVNGLIKLTTVELKAMLIEGIKKQKEDLIAHESQNGREIFTNLCKELDRELKAAEKLNVNKIEKDHAKGIAQ